MCICVCNVLQAEAARAEESARLHREFMVMLRKVLDGHMDSSTFEDSCRALLGTNSYVLFTLDKLIQKFIKHMAVSVAKQQKPHTGCRQRFWVRGSLVVGGCKLQRAVLCCHLFIISHCSWRNSTIPGKYYA